MSKFNLFLVFWGSMNFIIGAFFCSVSYEKKIDSIDASLRTSHQLQIDRSKNQIQVKKLQQLEVE